MTPVTLFSYITPEEQERMRICFDMHEAVYRNNETVMEFQFHEKNRFDPGRSGSSLLH